MKTYITYKRNNPSSVCGDSITVSTTYSSLNTAEIDALEEYYKQTIGYILIVPESEADNGQ